MKTRTGFVSNSSSSSFIVRFNQDPTDIDNLRTMMGDCAVNPYGLMIEADKVLSTVHNLILEQNKDGNVVLPFEHDEWDARYSAEEQLRDLGCYDASELPDGEYDALVNQIVEDNKQYKLKLYYRLKGTTPEEEAQNNLFVHKFTFSDECGSFWAAMEHGGVFRNVDHDVISHH